MNKVVASVFSANQNEVLDNILSWDDGESARFLDGILVCSATDDDSYAVAKVLVDSIIGRAHELIDDSVRLGSKSLAKAAIALIGERAFLKYKLEKHLTLYPRDYELIAKFAGDKLADFLGQ